MWEPMATLLVEIGCEELPAAACREAENQLPELCRRALGVEPTQILITPRRLAVLVEDVPERTPDQWMKGPPVAMREKAAAGFAKRHGVTVDELEERDGALGVEVPGRALADVLPEQVDAILRGLSFAKTMRWDDSGLRYPRPVRWTLAMVDSDKVVGEHSQGHRFAPGSLEIPQASAYVDTLRAADVEPDAAERRRQIVEALDALGEWTDPNGVLEEVVYLVEKAIVVDGRFDERYLQLPSRVIETTIQRHIRAFPLGENRFAFVANGGDPETVRSGVENVVEGRLEDASFTFERDVKVGIDGLAERLGSITFFAGGGTYADKTVAWASSSRLSAAARRRSRLRGLRRPTRPPSSSGSSRSSRVTSAASTHGSPAIRKRSRPRSTSSTCPTRPTRRFRRPRPGGSCRQPTRSTPSTSLSSSATGRPAPATPTASGARRSGSTGSRPRATSRSHARSWRARSPSSSRSASRAFWTRRWSTCAPRAGLRCATWAASRGWPRRSPRCRTSGSGRSTPPTRARAASRRRRKAPPPSSTRPCCSTRRRSRSRRRSSESTRRSLPLWTRGDFGAAVEAAAELGPLLDTFFEQVLVLADDRAVRANRLRLLLNVRDTLGRLGELSLIPR